MLPPALQAAAQNPVPASPRGSGIGATHQQVVVTDEDIRAELLALMGQVGPGCHSGVAGRGVAAPCL